jgi:hypothetical protein
VCSFQFLGVCVAYNPVFTAVAQNCFRSNVMTTETKLRLHVTKLLSSKQIDRPYKKSYLFDAC